MREPSAERLAEIRQQCVVGTFSHMEDVEWIDAGRDLLAHVDLLERELAEARVQRDAARDEILYWIEASQAEGPDDLRITLAAAEAALADALESNTHHYEALGRAEERERGLQERIREMEARCAH